MTSRYVAPMYTQLVNRQVQLTASGERKLRAMAKKPMAITRLATEFGVSNGVMKRELNRLGISLKPSTARKPKEKLIYRTRRGYYNLTKVGEAEVRRAIEQGASHSKIASIIGCGKTTAGSICTRYGLETDRARNAKKNIRRNLDDETKKKVLELYLLGAEMRSIASRVGCTQFVVLDALEEYGLPRYRINAAVRRLAEEDRKEIGADPQAYFDITVKKMRPLWITGLPFSKVNLRDAGVPESQHLFARAVWTVKSGLTKDELKRGPTKIDTVSDFLRFMDPILSSLPLTAATEAQMEPTDKYFRRLLSYIARIPNHKLRNTLGLAALIRTSQTGTSFYAYYTHTNALRRVMEKLADKFGWEALEDPEKFGAMIKSISSERHSNLGITERQSLTFLGDYRMVAHQVYSYLEVVDRKWRERLRDYLPIETERLPILRNFQWHRQLEEGRRKRRKSKTDLVHENFYKLRHEAALRLNSVRDLRAKVSRGIAAIKGIAEHTSPISMTIPDAIADEADVRYERNINLEIWTPELVALHCGEVPTSRRSHAPYLIRYVSTTDRNGKPAEPPWWVELVQARVNSADRAVREAFNQRWGYPASTMWTFPIALGAQGRTVVQASRLSAHGYYFFDLERLYKAALVGCLVVQLGTKTGMRIGEMQQISASADCLVELEGLVGGRKPIRGVRVIPKGRHEKETKYIDDVIFDLIFEVAKSECEALGTQRLPKVASETTRRNAVKARYVFQHAKSALKQGYINQCLRFIVHGLVLNEETSNHVFVSVHLLRHAFATELAQQGVAIDIIAKLLSHKRIEPTLYYSEPPAHLLRKAVHSIIVDKSVLSKNALRKAPQLLEQLKAAQDQVGGLAEVVGGTCTVGFSCQKKFACIGCAGNVPDPDKREQVLAKRQWATEQRDWAKANFLSQEVRHSERLIEKCDLMLAEMDALDREQADRERRAASDWA